MRCLPCLPLIALLALPAAAGDGAFSPRLPAELPACDARLEQRRDLNGDGVPDCFAACRHGGSGFGGTALRLQPGCEGRTFALDTFGSFADFVDFTTLPPELAQNRCALAAAVDLLFGERHVRAAADSRGLDPPPMDGSFRWLLDWYAGPARAVRAPFVEIRSYTPTWSRGPLAAPASQVTLLQHPLDKPRREDGRRDPGPVLAAYYAHNHGPFTPGVHCGLWQLSTTQHGVAIVHKKTGYTSWAFISSGAGVEKLRWPSLVRADCKDGLVFVERKLDQGARREVWVVQPDAGRLGRLPDGARLDANGPALGKQGRRLSSAGLKAALAPPQDWQGASDLDGDGRPDRIEVHFSGGAHCCYTLSVKLSRTGATHDFPFELDGGYPGGLDLSQPRRFDLTDLDGDGRPDLFMEIGTYNGQPAPLPPAWLAHGATSHLISISFPDGRPRITNY